MTDPSGSSLVIVQNNPVVDPLTAPVSRHARETGIDLVDLDLREGFSFDAVGLDFSAPSGIALHGSVGFLRAALESPSLAARLSWDREAFLAPAWREGLGFAYVGCEGRTMPAGEVLRLLSRGMSLAVRPELGLKDFRGGVYDIDAWEALAVGPDVPCFAMPPSRLLTEHRVWMAGGEPVAASLYAREGQAARSPDGAAEAMEAAARLTARYLPLDAIVVDVASTPDGWKVVEFNCIHTSGWYDANVGMVVDALLGRGPAWALTPR